MMAAKSGGLFYAPMVVQANTPAEVRDWCLTEFGRIADVLQQGASQGLRLDVLQKLPERPRNGMVLFFAAGIAGTSEGCYEYSAGAWTKL